MSSATDILKKYWGYEAFRKQQDKIIDTVIDGKDCLALLPTGGGKSICYQIPGLMKDGICLVISPLIALMEDQVQSLKSKGIKAIAINSSLSKRELDIQLDNAVYGKTKFLFVSPERLKTRLFLARLEKMNVNLIAVDEAHCISEWGYDFRPAYLEISALREKLPDTPVLALTATATPEVANDIQDKLNFKDGYLFQDSFERKNLVYNTSVSNNKINRLHEFLGERSDSGIIYASTRKGVKNLTQQLNSQGLSCTFYHGGLDHKIRKRRQEQWIKNETQIMIATNAFGMGIDKADVGFVAHIDIPETIEAYFQEAGRAGRNGEPAETHVFYEPADLKALETKVNAKFPAPEKIKAIYNCLGNYFQLALGSGLEEQFAFDLLEFSNRYGLDLIECFNALKTLEIAGYIKLSENFKSQSKVQIIVDNKALYQFQVRDKTTDRILQFLLRSHIGIFDDLILLDIPKIAKHTELPPSQIKQILEMLHQQEALIYIAEQDGSFISYPIERLQEDRIFLSSASYLNRKKTALKKLEGMLQFLSSKTCSQVVLLEYFGEKGVQTCGKCSRCKVDNNKPINVGNQSIITAYLLNHFNNSDSLSTSDLIGHFQSIPKDQIMDVLRWLVDHDKYRTDEFGETIYKV